MEWDGLELNSSGRAKIIGGSGSRSTDASQGYAWDFDQWASGPEVSIDHLF
jgi:hypothetical protein